jgi:hypothetical protein
MIWQAEGSTAFGPAVRVTPLNCPHVRVVWSGGTARGFAQCYVDGANAPVAYVQGTGAGLFLRRTATTRKVSQILSVTDDGTSTYLLYVGGTQAHPQVRLLKRSHGGSVTDKLLRSMPADYGSVVATKGKWWAVWSTYDAGIAGDDLWQAHTMGKSTAAQHTLTNDPGPIYDPALTLLTSTTVGLVWGTGHPFECPTLEWGTSSGASKWTRSASLKACGRQPVVSHVGGVWRVAWLEQKSDARQHVVLAERSTSGAWVKHNFTRVLSQQYAWIPALSLAVNGSSVGVSWSTYDSAGHSRAAVDIRRSGHWTDQLVNAGTANGATIETVAGPVGLSGINGAHAQVLMTQDDSSGFAVVRRQ